MAGMEIFFSSFASLRKCPCNLCFCVLDDSVFLFKYQFLWIYILQKKKKNFFIYSEPIPVHSSVNMGLNYTEDILLSGPALLIDCVHANPAAYV
jgi:hypothetical protein